MSFVLLDHPRPHVALITLSRPERMNAMAFDAKKRSRDWRGITSRSTTADGARQYADQDFVVELLGDYSNPNIVTRLQKILAGHGHDPVSGRTVRSPRRRLRNLDADGIQPLVAARQDGTEIDVLAEQFGIGRNTVMAHLALSPLLWFVHPAQTMQLRIGARLSDRVLTAVAGSFLYESKRVKAIGHAIDTDRFQASPIRRTKGESLRNTRRHCIVTH